MREEHWTVAEYKEYERTKQIPERFRNTKEQKRKQVKIPQQSSQWEALLYQQIKLSKLPLPVCEYKFVNDKRYRFDFAYPEYRIAIEVEGGVWSNGRHVRPIGFTKDCKKYNLAEIHGWQLLRFTSDVIKSGEALSQIEELLNGNIRRNKTA